MEFIHNSTTRKTINLIVGILFSGIGIIITTITVYGIFWEDDSSVAIPALIGIALLIAGIVLVYQYIFPSYGIGTVSDQSISCVLNNRNVLEIQKQDIRTISITIMSGEVDISVRMNDGTRKKINQFYFQDLKKFKEDLKQCGYRLNESK